MRTHNILSCYSKCKRSLLCLLPGAIINSHWLELPCLELVFIVPKVFKPLKFDCIFLLNIGCFLTRGGHKTGFTMITNLTRGISFDKISRVGRTNFRNRLN